MVTSHRSAQPTSRFHLHRMAKHSLQPELGRNTLKALALITCPLLVAACSTSPAPDGSWQDHDAALAQSLDSGGILLSNQAFTLLGDARVPSFSSHDLGKQGGIGFLDLDSGQESLTFRLLLNPQVNGFAAVGHSGKGSSIRLDIIPDEPSTESFTATDALWISQPQAGWYTIQISSDSPMEGLGLLAIDSGSWDPGLLFGTEADGSAAPPSLAPPHGAMVHTWLFDDAIPCGIVATFLADALGYDCPFVPMVVPPEACFNRLALGCEAGLADLDGDGYTNDVDCNDADYDINPGADEIWWDGIDQDCNGANDYDADADTYVSDSYGGADCDDLDHYTYPDAPEFCDYVDNDCDGDIDEDAVDADTYYADMDGDGFGDPDNTILSCTLLAGYVTNDLDCDDSYASVNPDAVEYCDGLDNDCDGDVDGDAVDASTWYADMDGDGYGSIATFEVSCSPSIGYVADASDCEDTDPSTYPGATEYCDGMDNDCDGSVDEDPLDGSLFYLDADTDGYGDPESGISTCDSSVDGYVLDNTDCDDSDASVYPDAPEICDDGVDQDCDGEDVACSLDPVSTLAAGDLVITEIMQDPAMVYDSTGEWFEIYNAGGFDVDLEGLQVVDEGSDIIEVTGSLPLYSGSYLVFGAELDSALNGGLSVDYQFSDTFTLGNSSDEIYLINEFGLIDGVIWDNGKTFPDPSGASMTLSPDSLDADSNDLGENWCVASSTYGDGDAGTPGSANDTCP